MLLEDDSTYLFSFCLIHYLTFKILLLFFVKSKDMKLNTNQQLVVKRTKANFWPAYTKTLFLAWYCAFPLKVTDWTRLNTVRKKGQK